MNQTRFRENQRPLIMKPKRVPPKRLYRFNRNALILLRVWFSLNRVWSNGTKSKQWNQRVYLLNVYIFLNRKALILSKACTSQTFISFLIGRLLYYRGRWFFSKSSLVEPNWINVAKHIICQSWTEGRIGLPSELLTSLWRHFVLWSRCHQVSKVNHPIQRPKSRLKLKILCISC